MFVICEMRMANEMIEGKTKGTKQERAKKFALTERDCVFTSVGWGRGGACYG